MTRDAQLPAARRRLRLIGGVFVVAFIALGLRLVDLALMSVDAATEPEGVAGAPQSARRADIVDRNGGLIATDYSKTSLFADPAEVLDHDLPFPEAVRRGAMIEPPYGVPEMPPVLEALAGLGRDVQGIIEHDLYPCAPDVPLPIAKRTKTYLSNCTDVNIDMGAVR